jgi:putative cardiolipin synthase
VVLTNSLATTDVAAVHGAYANYRKKLLNLGVELYEFQPSSRRRK